MKVALVQNHPIFGMKEKNIDELEKLIRSGSADLYILPEMAYTGYQLKNADELKTIADTVDSPCISRFTKLSEELNAGIILGFPELSADGKIYNSSIFITPEGGRHVYRKTHLFYKEKLFFAPGNTGFDVYEWRGVKIGLAICFDWYFSESFRTLALKGADIIAHCSNLVMPYCQTVDFARAIENRTYIATVNRIGTEERDGEKLTFTGGSVLVSPKGEYLIKAPVESTGIFISEINTAFSRNKSINDLNDVMNDRRPFFYFK
ncbi:MAG TPA: nitrilase-related carbon-nitrogen hydrolase [bacterium]|nr:nitrilase-related carbon-nitrogen hydrolase [bacterium]